MYEKAFRSAFLSLGIIVVSLFKNITYHILHGRFHLSADRDFGSVGGMRLPTIIYPPSIPWNWMFQRPQQIMYRLAALGYTVLYEDLGNDSKHEVQELSPSFYLCQGISALSVPHSRPRILWLTVPSHINLVEKYSPDLIVFDAVDEPKEEFASWAPYYSTILNRAQLVFTTAKSIYDNLSSQHPNVHLVPNAVDYVHFSAPLLPRPIDLPKENPLIGYSGAIAPWIDWDLVQFVVRENPDLQFIFIGSLFQMHKFPLKYRNATYLGQKSYAQLPSYLQQFAIGLIPFQLTEMTKGCNPIKLYEYYAAGLPVFGTPLPELLPIPKIHLEADSARFSLRLREIALHGDKGKRERLAYAQGNDWANRTVQIDQHLKESLMITNHPS